MPGPINRPPVMTPLTSVPASRETDGANRSGQPNAAERSTAAALRSADVLAETRRSTDQPVPSTREGLQAWHGYRALQRRPRLWRTPWL